MGQRTISLRDELSVVMAAPRLSVVAVVAVFGVVWGLGELRYQGELSALKQQVATLDTHIRGKDDHIARLEKKIEEDAALIETVRSAYQDLLSTQVPGLTDLLSATPSSVELLGGSEVQGTPLFQTLRETFQASGWIVEPAPTAQTTAPFATASEGAYVPVPSGIVLSLPDNESGQTVKAAFDAANIPYVLTAGSDEPEVPQIWITSGETSSEALLAVQP